MPTQPAPTSPPRPKRVRLRPSEKSLTIWLPVDLLDALDAYVARQQALVESRAPGARITRHAIVSTAIRQVLAHA